MGDWLCVRWLELVVAAGSLELALLSWLWS